MMVLLSMFDLIMEEEEWFGAPPERGQNRDG
jgi:hypothetical protein